MKILFPKPTITHKKNNELMQQKLYWFYSKFQTNYYVDI